MLKHSRDFNLTRECVLGSKLAPETPAYDVQQACGTGLEADDPRRQQDRARPDRRRRSPAASTRPPTRRSRSTRTCARCCSTSTGRSRNAGAAEGARQAPPPADRPRDPAQRRAAHGAVDGRARGDHGARVGHHARGAGRARGREPPQARRGLRHAASSTTWSSRTSGLERDQNLRPDSSLEKLAKLKPVFGGPDGTMTAGNSTPLSDGASAVLLASEEWAAEHGIPVQAYIVDAQTAAVDYVHKREGLLMAPAYAMPKLLARNGHSPAGLRLLRDPRGVRRPGAVHAEGVGGPGVLPRAARPRGAARRDRSRQAQRHTAARSPPAIRSAPPAAGSSPVSRRCSQAKGSGSRGADLDLRRRRPRRHRDHGGAVAMTDRYQQLINTPIGQIVSKQVGLPSPVKLERYEPGQPVIDGPVLLGAASASHLAGALESLLNAIGADLAPSGETFKALVFDATGIDSQRGAPRGMGVLSPHDPPGAELRPGDRARHPAGGVRDPARGDRPARARGSRPLDRQGGPPRRHRAAALRRTREPSRARVDAALLPLAEVGVRLRPGGADRRPVAPAATGRLGAAADRQGRARHRRRARDRRGDRRGARPRRRPRGRRSTCPPRPTS